MYILKVVVVFYLIPSFCISSYERMILRRCIINLCVMARYA